MGRSRPRWREALADGARERFGADVGIGITGIAGPDGGTEEKPVGLGLLLGASGRGRRERITRSARLPGDRADVRDRSTTVAMHLLRRLLLASRRWAARRRRRTGAERRDAGDERARLFVALELPAGVREALVALARGASAGERRGLRLIGARGAARDALLPRLAAGRRRSTAIWRRLRPWSPRARVEPAAAARRAACGCRHGARGCWRSALEDGDGGAGRAAGGAVARRWQIGGWYEPEAARRFCRT